MIERDDITEERFEEIIKKCLILDLEKMLSPDEFTKLLAHKLAKEVDADEEELYKSFIKREKDSNIVVYPGIAVLSLIIKGRNKFDIILVRSKKGIIFSDDIPPIHILFVIVSSQDQQSFYLHSIMWMIQISEDKSFEERCLNAKSDEELRKVILSSWRSRVLR